MIDLGRLQQKIHSDHKFLIFFHDNIIIIDINKIFISQLQQMLSTKSQQKEEVSQFKEYTYRYVILSVFSFISFVNGMCWVTVTPISVPISNAFGVSTVLVSLIPMSYLFVFPFVNFPSNWVLDIKGIKKSLVVGAILTALGSGVRCFCPISFGFVIVGQILCAVAQPFVINAVSKIAVRWFLPKNRSFALAVLSVINIVGTAVGFLLPSMFVDAGETYINIKNQFTELLYFQFLLAIISSILVLLFFKQSPPTLPSLGSMVQQMNFYECIKSLFRDRKFLGLMYAFGMVNGSFNIYGSLMDDIMDCWGFSNDQVGIYGFADIISGIICAAVLSLYVERTLRYRKVFVLLTVLGVFQCVAFPVCLVFYDDPDTQFWVFLLLVMLQGIIFIPFQPLTFDYACDILFPAGEAQITGTLMASGQIVGVILIVVSQQGFGLGDINNTPQQQRRASFYATVLTSVATLSGILLFPFYNCELKRSNIEQKKQGQQSLISSHQVD